MRRGRPLRFLAATLGGWTALRVALLWPATPIVAAAPTIAGLVPFDPIGTVRDGGFRPPIAPWPDPRVARRPTPQPMASVSSSAANSPADRATSDHALALAALVRVGPAAPTGPAPGVTPPLRPVRSASGPGRLAGSAWLIARGGSSRDPLAGQLGGSQAGARLTYTLGRGRRVALSARVAGPLGGGGGTEAAVGVDWQPTRAPFHLLAEQRIPLDGGRGGPAVLAIGGIGPVAVALGVRVEAYAQGGIVVRNRAEGFGDGAARLTTLVGTATGIRFDVGLGAWGGIQREARRLDLGPTLGAAVPVGRRAVRLTFDWRQRVAGNARPGSGPALSIGTDF